MANNFKPWVDTPTTGQNVQDYTTFGNDDERIEGFKAGERASAIRVNSALRQANVVVAAFMQMCDEIKALPTDLSLSSTVTAVKTAIKASLDALIKLTDTALRSYIDGKVSNLQGQITSNDADILKLQQDLAALTEVVDNLSGGSTTLRDDLDALEARVVKLETKYTKTVGTSEWIGDAAPYSFTIQATTHGKGAKPIVRTFVNNEETYDSPVVDTSGNVTVYTNAKVAIRVEIQ